MMEVANAGPCLRVHGARRQTRMDAWTHEWIDATRHVGRGSGTGATARDGRDGTESVCLCVWGRACRVRPLWSAGLDRKLLSARSFRLTASDPHSSLSSLRLSSIHSCAFDHSEVCLAPRPRAMGGCVSAKPCPWTHTGMSPARRSSYRGGGTERRWIPGCSIFGHHIPAMCLCSPLSLSRVP